MANFDLQVIVNEKPVRIYSHEGDSYIEGRKGSSFELEFHNKTSQKVLVVPSVDGLSPLDGKAAGADSPGMIAKPFSKIRIPGWMIDLQNTSRFEFQDKQKSYARSVTGSTSNVGVIGVLVFAEEEKIDITKLYHGMVKPAEPLVPVNPFAPINPYVPVWYSTDQTYTVGSINQLTTSANTASIDTTTLRSAERRITQDDNIGVGWGQKIQHKVKETSFDKGKQLAQMSIFYDSLTNLKRMGVIMDRQTYGTSRPNPFPGIGCTPPSGWKG